jgi:Uma2 family endonuclease/GNAT superfamily N-acetyltransferase
VEQPNEKTAITQKIMHALPAWFSPFEDIEKKAVIHRNYPFFTAYDDSAPIGFAALKIHNEYTADIFSLGVLEQYHRQGVGHRLLDTVERFCIDNAYLFLTVKTLDLSVKYEPYERTRAFYQKMGFIPLEVFTALWNEENPCLFLARYLGTNQRMSLSKFLDSQYYSGGMVHELICGEVFLMNPPLVKHGIVTMTLGSLFKEKLGASQRKVADNIGIYTDQEDSFLIPDLVVICDMSKVAEGKCIGGPELVAEVLSDSTKHRDLGIKREVYREIGTGEYWVLDIDRQWILVENFELGVIKKFKIGDKVKSWKFPEFVFAVKAVFQDVTD